MRKAESFDEAKKAEVLDVNRRISEDVENQIRTWRYGKLNHTADLTNFYLGEEAVELGIADSIETHHSAFSKLSINNDVRVL